MLLDMSQAPTIIQQPLQTRVKATATRLRAKQNMTACAVASLLRSSCSAAAGQDEGEGCTRSVRWRVTRRGGRRAVAPLGGTLLLARQQAGALFGHISTWAPTDAFSIQGHEKPFCDAEVGSGVIGSGLGLGLGLGLGFGVRVRGPNLRDDPADEGGH